MGLENSKGLHTFGALMKEDGMTGSCLAFLFSLFRLPLAPSLSITLCYSEVEPLLICVEAASKEGK